MDFWVGCGAVQSEPFRFAVLRRRGRVRRQRGVSSVVRVSETREVSEARNELGVWEGKGKEFKGRLSTGRDTRSRNTN